MSMEDVLHHLVDRAGARCVYGDPVVNGDTTVVPVASIAFGFGGGQGKGPRDGEGQGGGGGFTGKPAGYIEITSAGTRYVPIVSRTTLVVALGLGAVIGFVVGSRERRKLVG